MLTKQKQLFCDNYLITLNATEAARLAGYKTKRPDGMKIKAYSLMQEQEVKEYINERFQNKIDGLIVKQDEILEYLSGCIRGTETEKQLITLRSGEAGSFEDRIVEKGVLLKARDRLRAAEIMAKIYKLMDSYKEKEPVIIIKNSIPRS